MKNTGVITVFATINCHCYTTRKYFFGFTAVIYADIGLHQNADLIGGFDQNSAEPFQHVFSLIRAHTNWIVLSYMFPAAAAPCHCIVEHLR